MKIALFGANGSIGQRVLEEAVSRGHEVTAVVRTPANAKISDERVKVVKGAVLDPTSVATVVAGHNAVISAVGPSGLEDAQMVVKAAHSLLAGLKEAGVSRLLVVGGAASLEVAPGVELLDSPQFPEAWKPIATAHRDALAVYRADASDLDWTYLSPAALIAPGERTGHYRTGTDQLLTDAEGQSRISSEDYAIALVDQLEHPQFIRRRMTVAY